MQNPPSIPRLSKPAAGALLVVICGLLALVYQALAGGDLLLTPTPALPSGGEGAWYSLYFTDPAATSLEGGPDAALARAIDSAQVSVDVAAYQFNLWSLRDALLAAHRRGVTVRLVTDSDYLDEDEVRELVAAGIPVVDDRQDGLMHNKFAVIDRREVWTGSMNFTLNGAYKNDNNLLRLRSSRLAQDYLAEFEELFVDRAFGYGSPAVTPYTRLEIEGVPVEVYFAPEDRTLLRLLELLGGAQSSIRFLAYSFTSNQLRAALLDAHARGVSVSGVLEETQVRANTGGEYETLRAAGLDVRLDGNPRNMHHKVFILDERVVITGSYNFSASAEGRNDENTLILHSPEIARRFLLEFDRLFAQAAP